MGNDAWLRRIYRDGRNDQHCKKFIYVHALLSSRIVRAMQSLPRGDEGERESVPETSGRTGHAPRRGVALEIAKKHRGKNHLSFGRRRGVAGGQRHPTLTRRGCAECEGR